MIANKNVELLDNAGVKLTVTVDKTSIQKEYDELVEKYSKSLHIKGFRKGKIPSGVLIRKFGASLMGETAEKIIHKSLEEVWETVEQKPLPYATPEVDSEKPIELGSDFTFQVSYDTYPVVELSEYKGREYEVLKVKITPEDEERELKTLQEQNALVVDKKQDTLEGGDIVNIDYAELDKEGKEIPNSRRESFVFEVGSGYNLYRIDDEILGMKKGEERELKKDYAQDYELKELAGREVTLKVKVNSIKEKQLPELNDELAQDISDKYQSLEDLKEDIRQKLQAFAAQKVREHSISQILDKIVADAKIQLPQSMVEHDLARQWQGSLARFRTDEQNMLRQLQQEGKSKEEILENWRPGSEGRLKLQLAIAKMIEKEGLSLEEEEIDQKIREESESRGVDFEDLKAQMIKNNSLDLLTLDLKNEKLYNLLLEHGTSKKGKEVKFLDLAQGNY